MYISRPVKYQLLQTDCNEIWIFTTDFRKIHNTKFHKNPSSGSRVVPGEQMDGQTDMTKLIVAFRDFAKAPKNECWRALQHILPNRILQAFLSQACKAVVDPTLRLQC